MFVLKNHLTAAYLYIRAGNSSTSCTKILHGFCKNALILQYFVHFESVRSVVNQIKEYNNTFYSLKCILQSFKLSLLTGLSEQWFLLNYIGAHYLECLVVFVITGAYCISFVVKSHYEVMEGYHILWNWYNRRVTSGCIVHWK